jgi:Mg-chelatase subunit ChlD
MYSIRHAGIGIDDRAASALVGLVLLFGLVFAGAGIIYWAGMDAKQSVQSASGVDTAEASLQEVSSKLSSLSFKGNGTVTSFDLSGKDPSDVTVEDMGRLRFRINQNASCTHEMELGSIVYGNDDGSTVAYQAGGVFKKQESGVTIVQSPALEYRSQKMDNETIQTIRFPVVNVSGNVDGVGDVTAQANQKQNDELEENLCLAGSSNAVSHIDNVTVTVEDSPFYSGWIRYFESEFGEGHVIANNSDPSTRTASYVVELGQNNSTTSNAGPATGDYVVPGATVRAAVWSSQNELKFQSSSGAHRPTIVDSYDSSKNPYPVENGSQAVIVNDGKTTIKQNTEIYGDVFAAGNVNLQGSNSEPVLVEGEVVYNGSKSGNHYTITGQSKHGFGFVPDGVASPDSEIQEAIANAQSADVNNNTETNVFKTGRGEIHAGTVTHGIYYSQDFTFDVDDDEKVVFDTSDGDIIVVVDGPIDSESRIEVRGDGQVRFFVKGGVTMDNKVKVYDEGASTPNNDSTRLRMYVHSGYDIAFEKHTEFTGVVYTPDGGDVALRQGSPTEAAEVYGAVVGGKAIVNKGAQVHYDLAAKDSGAKSSNESAMPAPDDDDDGVPDAVDECPNGDGSGVNGCGPVTEDEAQNALVVNQSSAKLTVVGSMVADNKTVIREVGEREPLDVVFVIDDSGSMGDPVASTYSPIIGEKEIHDSYTGWSEWVTPSEASYVDEWEETVPPGEAWDVKKEDHFTGNTYTEVFYPGEEIDFSTYGSEDDILKIHRSTTNEEKTYTVPDGEVWLAKNDEYDDRYDSETKWYYPGDTIESSDWKMADMYDAGNDPQGKRETAMQQFVGFLNASNGDHVGVVEFSGADADVEWEIDDDPQFGNVNDSLDLDSTGGTPLTEAILEGEDQLLDGGNDEKVMVLLTDGQPSYYDDDDIVDAARDNLDDDVSIQTVGLGSGADEQLLKDIASVTDGNYSKVGEADQLEETFRKIAGSVTDRQVNIIEYKNTTVEVEVDTSSVTLSGNANDPTNDTRPSKVIDIADLQGASDDELEKYVGTLVNARAETRSCSGNTTFDTTTGPDGETYEEVTCNATSGTFDDVGNANDATHKIYVDGESLPSSSEFDTGWFKEDSFGDVIDDYESDTGKTLVDDGANEFDLGENDAIMVVKTNSSNDDTDYVVLHFEAYDTDVDYDVDPAVSADPPTDTDGSSGDPPINNSYVVNIDENNVEVGNESSTSMNAGILQPSTEPLESSEFNPVDASHVAARVAEVPQ